jgi:hypothetical protein
MYEHVKFKESTGLAGSQAAKYGAADVQVNLRGHGGARAARRYDFKCAVE